MLNWIRSWFKDEQINSDIDYLDLRRETLRLINQLNDTNEHKERLAIKMNTVFSPEEMKAKPRLEELHRRLSKMVKNQ